MLKKCSFFLKTDQKLPKNSKNLKKTAKNGGKLNAAKSLVYCLSIGKYLIGVYISIGKLNTFVPGKTIKLKSYFDRSTKLRTILFENLMPKFSYVQANFA